MIVDFSLPREEILALGEIDPQHGDYARRDAALARALDQEGITSLSREDTAQWVELVWQGGDRPAAPSEIGFYAGLTYGCTELLDYVTQAPERAACLSVFLSSLIEGVMAQVPHKLHGAAENAYWGAQSTQCAMLLIAGLPREMLFEHHRSSLAGPRTRPKISDLLTRISSNHGWRKFQRETGSLKALILRKGGSKS